MDPLCDSMTPPSETSKVVTGTIQRLIELSDFAGEYAVMGPFTLPSETTFREKSKPIEELHSPRSDDMEAILTRCGYRCDLCLAYRPNVEKEPANRQILSDGWFRYFGFRLPAEAILCDGCMSEDPNLLDKNCAIRSCVVEKDLDHCAQCDQYICEKLKSRLVVYEEIAKRVGAEIPQADYLRFIRPYENKRRLDGLRAAKA